MSKARYLRTQDKHIVGPLTEKQAAGMAGFAEGEWQVEQIDAESGMRVWTPVPASAQKVVDDPPAEGGGETPPTGGKK